VISPDFAYIGPGAGFAFLGSFLTLALSVLASIASLLLWPFRMIRMAIRRRRGMRAARVKKVIFLGLDGLDAELTEKWMAEGKLPNLAGLNYKRLRTTCPPLSPVAWSTFATGVNPGKHNIFDFLNRDLRSYAPELSSAKVRPPRRVLRIGKFEIPLSRPTVEMRRKSEPFWKILDRNGVGSTILRVPVTFPPDDFNGRLLSAMSTPDLRGSQGTFSLFTNGEGALEGPENGEPIPFRVVGNVLEIQGETYSLALGEYTPWIRLKFRANGSSVAGIVRFLLSEKGLYATPVQIVPENPALPISQPAYYSAYLAKLLGSFATLGLAEDTSALNDGAIDEDAFLKQVDFIQREREAMFFNALDHMRGGALACVFDTSDRVQHMFYRYLNPALAGSEHAGVMERMYRDMDRLVGDALKYVDRETALFVLSDHGFCAFRRGVNLNSWLRGSGYLALVDERQESGEYFEGIDWSRTRAYTFGLGGLYLNLRSREAQGIVDAENAGALKAELIAKLTGLRDEETGDVAIQQVYAASAIYHGPYLDAAPDLIVGYARGYRTSWEAAVGKSTARVFEDNLKAWSGDHCVDPSLVPGVLFSNLKLDAENPGIEDMAPTALRLFGIETPPWMEGKPVIA